MTSTAKSQTPEEALRSALIECMRYDKTGALAFDIVLTLFWENTGVLGDRGLKDAPMDAPSSSTASAPSEMLQIQALHEGSHLTDLATAISRARSAAQSVYDADKSGYTVFYIAQQVIFHSGSRVTRRLSASSLCGDLSSILLDTSHPKPNWIHQIAAEELQKSRGWKIQLKTVTDETDLNPIYDESSDGYEGSEYEVQAKRRKRRTSLERSTQERPEALSPLHDEAAEADDSNEEMDELEEQAQPEPYMPQGSSGYEKLMEVANIWLTHGAITSGEAATQKGNTSREQ